MTAPAHPRARGIPFILNNKVQRLQDHMRHVTSVVAAIMPGPVHSNRGPRMTGLIMDEQHHKPERGFAGGYVIETAADNPAGMVLFYGGWVQVRGIPNLFASDGSLFPTSAAANPTLTIVALAIRQARHIADRMARCEL